MNEQIKLNNMLKPMPSFVREYILSIETSTTIKTRIAKLHDLNTFFNYMCNEAGKDKIDFEVLSYVDELDIDEFMHYLSHRVANDRETSANNKAKSRYLSSVRSFYNFLNKRKYIEHNPTMNINNPKIVRADKDTLTFEEQANLLDFAKSYSCGKVTRLTEATQFRNYTIILFLLTTGIRVSELASLNTDDINIKPGIYEARITRKGGKEQIIYLSDKLSETLKEYMELHRKTFIKGKSDNKELFYNKNGERMSVRSVEKMVKQIASFVTPKKITPHRLRATYGEDLYNATGDIYEVADTLGHSSVATTTKHYVRANKDKRKLHRNILIK